MPTGSFPILYPSLTLNSFNGSEPLTVTCALPTTTIHQNWALNMRLSVFDIFNFASRITASGTVPGHPNILVTDTQEIR